MRIHVSIVDEPEAPGDEVSLLVSNPDLLARLVAALTPPDKSGYRDRLVIKNGGRLLLLKTCDVDWIEAEGNYVVVHVGKEKHMLRETIGNLEAQLDPLLFRRIHRSTIVNVDRIKELRPQAHGDLRVLLETGTQLTLSRGYREDLLKALSVE